MEFYFSIYNWNTVAWISTGIAFVALIWLLTVYRSRISLARNSEPEVAATGELPGVSVIVHASDNPQALGRMLPAILGQEYSGELEVIVVNDGHCEEVGDVVKLLGAKHRNLRATFIPEDARNLSRRKLAISLGVKAARQPVVLLTSAECSVASPHWVKLMAEPFAQGKEVVLGNVIVAGLKSAADRFDQVFANTIWMKSAQKGNAYRGNGFNIAYSRELFFAAKGFAGSLTLEGGDDDIFINRIATRTNTAVVTDSDARVEVLARSPAKALREQRLAHFFTGLQLPTCARRVMGFSAWSMWLWLAAVTTGAVFGLPNILPAMAVLLTVPAVWIPIAMRWRRTGHMLGIKLPVWRLPWLAMTHFSRTLRYRWLCSRPSRKNFTWSRV